MANYQEVRFKLTNTKLNKVKSPAKNKAVATLRLNKKIFKNEELPYELFLAARQTNKIRNPFVNNMLTDIKLSKAQISIGIQSVGFFGSWLGNLGKKTLINIAFALVRHSLPGLASNLTSNLVNESEKKK